MENLYSEKDSLYSKIHFANPEMRNLYSEKGWLYSEKAFAISEIEKSYSEIDFYIRRYFCNFRDGKPRADERLNISGEGSLALSNRFIYPENKIPSQEPEHNGIVTPPRVSSAWPA